MVKGVNMKKLIAILGILVGMGATGYADYVQTYKVELSTQDGAEMSTWTLVGIWKIGPSTSNPTITIDGLAGTITADAGVVYYSTSSYSLNADKLDDEEGSYYGVKADIGNSTAANRTSINLTGAATGVIQAALTAEIAETDINFTNVKSSLTEIHDNYARKDSTTNWTGDNTFNGIKIKAGSYVTKIKGGEQTGNIVYTLPVSTDGVAGYHLQYLPSGALSWQPPELVGVQNYYYSTQTINGDYVMYSSHSAVAEGSISKTITEDVILGTWTTLSGYPTGDAIPAGTWDVHIHAVQTAGKDCRLYGKIYLKASGGSLTYLGETGKTKVLSDTEQAYDIMLQTGVINLTAGDAILMVGNAEPSGNGSDPQITIYFGGTKGSLLALPAPTIDVNNYIPYSGATKDVNLGAYNITAANLTTDFATVNSSLTDIHNNYTTDAEFRASTVTLMSISSTTANFITISSAAKYLNGYIIDDTNAGTNDYILKWDSGEGDWNWEADGGGNGAGSSIISKNFFLPTTPWVTNYADKTSFGDFAVIISSIIVMCDDCPRGSKTQFNIRITTPTTDFTGWGTPWSILPSTYTLYVAANSSGTIITSDNIADATIPAGAKLILDVGVVGSDTAGSGFVINLSGEVD